MQPKFFAPKNTGLAIHEINPGPPLPGGWPPVRMGALNGPVGFDTPIHGAQYTGIGPKVQEIFRQNFLRKQGTRRNFSKSIWDPGYLRGE